VEGRHEQIDTRRHRLRLTVRLRLLFVVSSLACLWLLVCCLVFFTVVQMADRGWKGKGEKAPRRSPRKRGKTWSRSFKAPRPVEDLEDSDVQLVTTDRDSQVQIIRDRK
jgi:hypothetical protein